MKPGPSATWSTNFGPQILFPDLKQAQKTGSVLVPLVEAGHLFGVSIVEQGRSTLAGSDISLHRLTPARVWL